MKRTARQALARETVAILERGRYSLPGGDVVSLAEPLAACLASTRYFTPKDLGRLKYDILATPALPSPAEVEVRNETTLAGAKRSVTEAGDAPVAALNFASARNPGGGFLNGSEAQEESLARSSGLYASLLQAPDFYDRHRQSPSYLYSDAMILSPASPVFRDDDGSLRGSPYRVTFITSAAPNAGAASDNRPEELQQLPDVFRQRAEYVLALAASQGVHTLILGAWGCGVFRNDPELVARTFAELLIPGGLWRGRFRRVVFSVLDRSTAQPNFTCFRDQLANIG